MADPRLGMEIGPPFDRAKGGPGGWVILDEPELHLHGDALVPDLAGWRREHMPEVQDVAAFELPPDWVCKVLSVSMQRHDRISKMRIYAREGVRHVWLVDPTAQTLEVYELSWSWGSEADPHPAGSESLQGPTPNPLGAPRGAPTPLEFLPSGSAWVRCQIAEGTEVVRAVPFEAIELELAVLWEK